MEPQHLSRSLRPCLLSVGISLLSALGAAWQQPQTPSYPTLIPSPVVQAHAEQVPACSSTDKVSTPLLILAGQCVPRCRHCMHAAQGGCAHTRQRGLLSAHARRHPGACCWAGAGHSQEALGVTRQLECPTLILNYVIIVLQVSGLFKVHNVRHATAATLLDTNLCGQTHTPRAHVVCLGSVGCFVLADAMKGYVQGHECSNLFLPLLTLNTICCSWPPAEAARSCLSLSRWLRALSVSVIASLGAAAGSTAAAASIKTTACQTTEREPPACSQQQQNTTSAVEWEQSLSPAALLLATATSCCLLQRGAAWRTRLHTGFTAAAAAWWLERGTAEETGWQCLESSIVGVVICSSVRVDIRLQTSEDWRSFPGWCTAHENLGETGLQIKGLRWSLFFSSQSPVSGSHVSCCRWPAAEEGQLLRYRLSVSVCSGPSCYCITALGHAEQQDSPMAGGAGARSGWGHLAAGHQPWGGLRGAAVCRDPHATAAGAAPGCIQALQEAAEPL